MDTIWTNFAGAGVKEAYIDANGVRTRVLEAGSVPGGMRRLIPAILHHSRSIATCLRSI